MNAKESATLPEIWADCLFFRINVALAAIGFVYFIA